MTPSRLAALMRGIAPALADYVAEAVRPLLGRVDALEARRPEPGPVGPAGPVGAKGKDGTDGVGFDDLAVEYDGQRTFALVFTKGSKVVRREVAMPVVLDRGVYNPGTGYVPGDAVSYQGALWIAQEPTGVQPGTSKAWRLAVKKGRDGRDGKDGAQGPPGREGPAGRDLTQLGPDGRKW